MLLPLKDRLQSEAKPPVPRRQTLELHGGSASCPLLFHAACLVLVIVCGAFLASCQPALPELPLAPDAGATVRFEPDPVESVSPVFVAHLRGPSASPLPRLFEGALSDYQLGRADDHELTQTLGAREVPLFYALESTDGALTAVAAGADDVGSVAQVTPRHALEPGDYSLVTGAREQIVFQVARGAQLLRRVWPRSGISSGQSIYCAEERRSQTIGLMFEVPLVPAGFGDLHALAQPGCFRLAARQVNVAGAITPLQLGDWLLEPTWFRPALDADEIELSTTDCPGRLIAEACLSVVGDRLVVEGSAVDSFWIVDSPVATSRPVLTGQRAFLAALATDTEMTVELQVVDALGRHHIAAIQVRTGRSQPEPILSEVMANPLGPEPQQEWIELFNAGTASAPLAGWKIQDGDGEIGLGEAELEPGSFALVVSDAFDLSLGWEVVPEANTLLIRVPRLSASGLSNSGEALRLIDPSGTVRSQFPDLPHPEAGTSVARKDLWASGGLSSDEYGTHAAPGASPGGDNTVR